MLIKDAPIGTRIYFGAYRDEDLIWRKVSDQNDFLSESAVARRRFDYEEPDNTNRARRSGGNNFFPHSNILQWLNSRVERWYQPAHSADVCWVPFGDHGFLNDFTNEEFNALMDREITVGVPLGSRKEFGKTVSMTTKVCLPAAIEVFGRCEDDNCNVEGSKLDEIENFIRDGQWIRAMLTRTGIHDSCRVMAAVGCNSTLIRANEQWDIRPMIRLNGDLEISDEGHGNSCKHLKIKANKEKDEQFFNLLTM